MTADIAIVTGASGGIGRALCLGFRDSGYTVIGIDREHGASQASLAVDMNDTERLSRLDQEIDPSRIKTIVHNAAVQPLAAAGETSTEDWWESLRVNVIAVDTLVGVFQEGLRANRGSVVAISSVHARATTRGINAYATTKAALEGWVRSACLDLAPQVRVNGIAPGAIDTPKLREGLRRWPGTTEEDRLAELCQRTALQRVGAATEVADLALFLASDSAAFITGTTVVIDGGASARLGSE